MVTSGDGYPTGDLVVGDMPVAGRASRSRIDLSEAYAAVRRRGRALRRRRIISSALAATVLAGVFTVVGVYYVSSIPMPDALSLPATTTVYYADGHTVLARLGSQSRVLVDIDTLPEHVPAAVIAAEDPGFWLDSATLISRRYARVATGVDGGTLAGEARLLVMSWKLEDTFNKRQILGFYLNTVYFGRGAYGIQAAARAYFGKDAKALTVAEAVVLAGLIAAPGDGRFDPTVDQSTAGQRFVQVAEQMSVSGAITPSEASALRVPRVAPYDPGVLESELDRPTGLVVAQVLAELRQHPSFRDKAPGFLENGGFAIVTTIDARAQALLEAAADETVQGSVMAGQPTNLQAAAVVVEPGTGRVLAYYGGHDGTGADYAGWYVAANGRAAGYGAHPPGATFDVYTLAAGLRENISVGRSGRRRRPGSFRPAAGWPTIRSTTSARRRASRPARWWTRPRRRSTCPSSRWPSGWAPLQSSIWPAPPASTRCGYRPRPAPTSSGTTCASAPAPRCRPRPFGTEVSLGDYPVTVLDQANAMATFAADGRRSLAHFVRRVTKDVVVVVAERVGGGVRVLAQPAVADITWALAQNPAGALPGGGASATKTGVGLLRTSQVETAHAWIVGYTPKLAMAVWVGNEGAEFPLRDSRGARVTGSGLPSDIYRTFMVDAPDRLGLARRSFVDPQFTGQRYGGRRVQRARPLTVEFLRERVAGVVFAAWAGSRRGPVRPRTLKPMRTQRQVVDYSLQKRALLREVYSGRVATLTCATRRPTCCRRHGSMASRPRIAARCAGART